MEGYGFSKWWQRAIVALLVLLGAAFFTRAYGQQLCPGWVNHPSPQANAFFSGSLGTANDPGASLATGDVNGDGRADIIVGASGQTVGGNANQGRVYVFDGLSRALINTLDNPGPQANAYFGFSVAAGDVNGDGKADIIVGAYNQTVSGNSGQGQVFVFSGANGALLYTLNDPTPQANARFGFSVAAGDVNADGKADIIVGAAYQNVGAYTAEGQVFVFSGANGALLYTLDDPTPSCSTCSAGDRFGWSVAAGDVNGDGKADIIVGAFDQIVTVPDPRGGEGRVFVFSGAMAACSVP